MALFKFIRILNFRVGIGMNLAMGLTVLADSAFNFDCLSLVVAFLYEISMVFYDASMTDKVGFL